MAVGGQVDLDGAAHLPTDHASHLDAAQAVFVMVTDHGGNGSGGLWGTVGSDDPLLSDDLSGQDGAAIVGR
jgi:hypothetical protein